MKHFKLEEFACRCCGSNGTLQAMGNTKALVEAVLDPAREAYGKPIYVNSGYRCEKHNAEVGGVANSQHMKGEAADIAPAGFKFQVSGFKNELERLKEIIIKNGKFDQLIIYPTFLHVSWKRSGENRKQILYKQ